MHAVRPLLLATLLPLFAGCQLFDFMGDDAPAELSGQTRMQGTLTAAEDGLVFTPCDSSRTFKVNDNGNTGIAEEAAALGDGSGALFADVRGRFDGNTVEGSAGDLNLQTLYRLERASGGCKDPNFKLSGYYAQGHGPEWGVRVSPNGMKVQREGQPDLAVPYMQEQIPGGGTSLSSEANHQRIELWIAPQRCVDGTRVTFLSAELRLGDQVQRGCAYPGGAQGQ